MSVQQWLAPLLTLLRQLRQVQRQLLLPAPAPAPRLTRHAPAPPAPPRSHASWMTATRRRRVQPGASGARRGAAQPLEPPLQHHLLLPLLLLLGLRLGCWGLALVWQDGQRACLQALAAAR